MSKPFNLADAKLGHPVQTSYGDAATILKFDASGVSQFRHYGYTSNAEHGDRMEQWTDAGRSDHGYDLVMAPLGQVDGRDVYPGDMLRFNGEVATSPVPYGVPFRAGEWSWPHRYPVTRMTLCEINVAATSVSGVTCSLSAVANAAIAHGIDNGYLIDARELASALPGMHGTPDLLQSVRDLSANSIRKINDDYFEMLKKIADMVGHEAGTPLAELPEYVTKFARAIAQAGMVVAWHKAYDQGGLRIDCPRLRPDELDSIIASVKV